MIEKVSILSMNCRGLADPKKRRDVMHFIRHKGFDIIFLQDTHLTTQTTQYFNTLWHGACYHSCFSNRSRGTSILINSSLQHTLVTYKTSECGNFCILVCNIANESYLFVNIYGPNEDNPTFYKNLSETIGEYEVQHTIVAGDFNFVIEPEKDSFNYAREYNILAKQKFMELTYKYNLIDAWRSTYPNERKYTWLRKNPMKAGRLDMFFVSDSLVNAMKDVDITQGYRTDHNAITLSFQGSQRRGNGMWKFNTSHLADDDYVRMVKKCITETIRQYAVPVYNDTVFEDTKQYESIQLTISETLFYETLIMMIRGDTVKFSKQKAKRTRSRETDLLSKIAETEQKFLISKKQSDASNLSMLEKELEELRRPMIEGLIVRSRVMWHEQGERSTKYFLSLEKRNACRKNIQYIRDGDKNITDNAQIIENFSKIYERKYQFEEHIITDLSFILNNIKNKLSSNEKIKLDTEISMAELTNAQSKMKKGKTPGSNGFPIEFFRTFWLEISPFLLRAIKLSFNDGEKLPSHHEGIITLIPKKGKSPHAYKGWRPITLLNVDYKIVSTVISNRLKTVMTKLINPAQTAYTSNRYIGENTRLVYDIIHWSKFNNEPGAILAADFEAAFESIAWQYLKSVIQEFNFGPNLTHMMNHLYFNKQNFSRILLNGHLGRQIYMQRGIRQGDPASGYLFNLAVSLLTEQINNSAKLTGIKINQNNEIRISQYADDTIMFLDGSDSSVSGAIEELNEFGKHSGLRINVEKTSCMTIGSLAGKCASTKYKINNVENLTILGINIGSDLKNITEQNMDIKMPKIKNEIEQWKRRSLTPVGRINVVKALLLSRLVHLFMALPNPSANCIKELEKMFFHFVWGGKKDKVKRSRLVQSYSMDGLKMIDINSFIKSMKLTWLKRLNFSTADWVVFATQELPNLDQLLMYGSEKLKLCRNAMKNQFYKDQMNALIDFNLSYKPSDNEIITECIWFSDQTKYKTAIVKKWNEKGLRFIGDLYNSNTGAIYSKNELELTYGISMTFLCYTALIKSLPIKLQSKVNITNLRKPYIPYKVNIVMNQKKFSKTAYRSFVENKATNDNVVNDRLQTKWINDVGEYIRGSVQSVTAATKSIFLVYLHYRIVSRIYATNKYLTVINIKQCDVCTFCNNATESICHLFWQCPSTQFFIKEILSHLRRNYNMNLNINAKNWFFLTDLSHLEVLVVTVAKATIHRSRLQTVKPSVDAMLHVLKSEAKIEYYVAKTNNSMDAFERRWGELKKILE